MNDGRVLHRFVTQRSTLLALATVAVLALVDVRGLLPLATALQPVVEFTAAATATLLWITGVDVLQNGGVIHLPGGFGYEIDYRCTGLWPVMILSALILTDREISFPRLTALCLGTAMLTALNFVRLTSLFWIGVSHPDWFDLMHDFIWPIVTILAVAACWFGLRRCYFLPECFITATDGSVLKAPLTPPSRKRSWACFRRI